MGPGNDSKRSCTKADLQKWFPEFMIPVTENVDPQGHQSEGRRETKRKKRKHRRMRVRSFKKKKDLKQEIKLSSATTLHQRVFPRYNCNGKKALKTMKRGETKDRRVPGKKTNDLEKTVLKSKVTSDEGQRNWMVPAILMDRKPLLLYDFEDGKTKTRAKKLSVPKNLPHNVFQLPSKGIKKLKKRNEGVSLIRPEVKDFVRRGSSITRKYHNGNSQMKKCKRKNKGPVLKDTTLLCKPRKHLGDGNSVHETRESQRKGLCSSGKCVKMLKDNNILNETCVSQFDENCELFLETDELGHEWNKNSRYKNEDTKVISSPLEPVLTMNDLNLLCKSGIVLKHDCNVHKTCKSQPEDLCSHGRSEPHFEKADELRHEFNKNCRNKNKDTTVKVIQNPLEPGPIDLNLLCHSVDMMKDEEEDLCSPEQCETSLESEFLVSNSPSFQFSEVPIASLEKLSNVFHQERGVRDLNNLKDTENTVFLRLHETQSYQIKECRDTRSKKKYLNDAGKEKSYLLLDLYGSMEIRNGSNSDIIERQISCGRSRR